MSDRFLAREMMRTDFTSVPETATLRDALAAHLAGGNRPDPARTLAVIAEDGSLRGLLSSDALLRALLGGGGESVPAGSRLELAADRLPIPIREVMRHSPPTVGPDDGLPTLIARATDDGLAAVPVVEAGRLLGFVGRGDVFLAAASLALDPGDGAGESESP